MATYVAGLADVIENRYVDRLLVHRRREYERDARADGATANPATGTLPMNRPADVRPSGCASRETGGRLGRPHPRGEQCGKPRAVPSESDWETGAGTTRETTGGRGVRGTHSKLGQAGAPNVAPCTTGEGWSLAIWPHCPRDSWTRPLVFQSPRRSRNTAEPVSDSFSCA